MKRKKLNILILLVTLITLTIITLTIQPFTIFGDTLSNIKWTEANWNGEEIPIQFLTDGSINPETKFNSGSYDAFKVLIEENNIVECEVAVQLLYHGTLGNNQWIKYNYPLEWIAFVNNHENVVFKGDLIPQDFTYSPIYTDKFIFTPYTCRLRERFPVELYPSANVFRGLINFIIPEIVEEPEIIEEEIEEVVEEGLSEDVQIEQEDNDNLTITIIPPEEEIDDSISPLDEPKVWYIRLWDWFLGWFN